MEDFSVQVTKEGYEFSANGPFNFKSKKLSFLKIHFVDSESRQPLGDTLVSLRWGKYFQATQFFKFQRRRKLSLEQHSQQFGHN